MTEATDKREQKREERRQQILEAALAVFLEKGFNATKVSDVAARAGVSQGTIYWYFESKESLFKAAVQPFLRVDVEDEETQAILTAEMSATDKLHQLAMAMESFAETAQGLYALLMEFWFSSSHRQEVSQMWRSLLIGYGEVVTQVIRQGIAAGEFRPVDAEALVWALLAVSDGLAIYKAFMPELDLGRVGQVFIETLLAGLSLEDRDPPD